MLQATVEILTNLLLIAPPQPQTKETRAQTNTDTGEQATDNNQAVNESETAEEPEKQSEHQLILIKVQHQNQRQHQAKQLVKKCRCTGKMIFKHFCIFYDGLVAQLEYEKFSHADAVYGADNSGADWNEQAIKNAKSYLATSAFSLGGLKTS